MKVYVAATRQNDGKTIASVGLIAAILKRKFTLGYIKPVGQHYVEVGQHKVDEDAILIKDTYRLDCDLPDMSPVAIPKGFTEQYIENPNRDVLADQIGQAFANVSAGKDLTLIEGTGHAGVGSVFDMSNADVARLLGAKVLLVAGGGIGRPIDEVMLNKALFDQLGVGILGVIINKVQQDKYDKIAPLVRKGLARKGLDCFGVMPYRTILSSPTLRQLTEDMGGNVISGFDQLDTPVENIVIGAMPPHEALDYFTHNALLITPGTREDIVLAALTSHLAGGERSEVSGIVLTGSVPPHKNVMRLITKIDIPVISVPIDTFKAATKISNLMVKIRSGQTDKIRATEELVEEYVEVDRLLETLKSS